MWALSILGELLRYYTKTWHTARSFDLGFPGFPNLLILFTVGTHVLTKYSDFKITVVEIYIKTSPSLQIGIYSESKYLCFLYLDVVDNPSITGCSFRQIHSRLVLSLNNNSQFIYNRSYSNIIPTRCIKYERWSQIGMHVVCIAAVRRNESQMSFH